MTTEEQRNTWIQRAHWLAGLGLTEDEGAPTDIAEELADAVVTLVAEVRLLERERADARAWAWSEFHRDWEGGWLPYTPVPELTPPWDWDVPSWLTDATKPTEQDWWPAGYDPSPDTPQ